MDASLLDACSQRCVQAARVRAARLRSAVDDRICSRAASAPSSSSARPGRPGADPRNLVGARPVTPLAPAPDSVSCSLSAYSAGRGSGCARWAAAAARRARSGTGTARAGGSSSVLSTALAPKRFISSTASMIATRQPPIAGRIEKNSESSRTLSTGISDFCFALVVDRPTDDAQVRMAAGHSKTADGRHRRSWCS